MAKGLPLNQLHLCFQTQLIANFNAFNRMSVSVIMTLCVQRPNSNTGVHIRTRRLFFQVVPRPCFLTLLLLENYSVAFFQSGENLCF